ncbi:hypothetical protein MMC15_003833 [Xylographa vitiligo]|nr:hypothetical protein [Xylographa vitiligo]
MDDIHVEHTTGSSDVPNHEFMPDLHLPAPQTQLGQVNWQESCDIVASDGWHSFLSSDNALLPFVPMANESSSSDNMIAFDGDHSIFDNPPARSTEPIIDVVYVAPSSKASVDDTSSKPGSSCAARSRIEKRKANTLAARRYRQNRVDMISQVESALKVTQQERDALKVQLAKLQGENQVLKDLVGRSPWGRDGDIS